MAYVDVVFGSADGLDAGAAGHRPARGCPAPEAAVGRAPLRRPGGVEHRLGVRIRAHRSRAGVVAAGHAAHSRRTCCKPALSAIPGVAEVATVGGEVQEVRVDVKARLLRDQGLAFSDVIGGAACRWCNGKDGAVSKATPNDIADIMVTGGDGAPVRLGDVALVRLAEDMPTGMADVAGSRAVGGIIIARRDANIAELVAQAKTVIAREARKLPHRAADPEREDSGAAADVHVATTYDRAELATRVRSTLLRALAEEVAVVVLVILLFLLHGRSALVPLVTLPVVVLLTFGAMWLLGVPATIMSLGGIGIALGLAVDADIVALEASHRQLETLSPGASAERPPRAHHRRRAVVRAGDPDVAGDHRAVVPAGVRVLGRDRPSLAPARADQDAGGRGRRAGDADAGAGAARAPAARARDPRVRQPAHARAGADLPAIRALRAQPAGADAGDGGAGVDLVPADRPAHRRRVPAARRGGRSALHADDAARRVARRGGAAAVLAGPRHEPVRRGRVGVRQGRARRYRHRPGAVRDGGDDDPPAAAIGVAQGRARALVLELGARAVAPDPATRVARSDAAHDRRAGRRAGQGGAPAGLDGGVDRAGARAHGHDGDRRAHADRDPDRVAGSAAAGRRRHGAARAGRAHPGHAQRGVRIAGRRELGRLQRRQRGDAPAAASIPTRRTT